ncbi:MAG TPA: DUF5916 domain-containing protein [Vicinamibacterales bacterium]|nr:DUF5916 domain-containing protein [Vicinamibacterales bacterium]
MRRSSSFYSACLTVLCIVALGGGIVRAQNPQLATPTGRGRDVPTAEAARLNDGPVVDGDVLDDPVWKSVPVIAGFKQYQPFEGQPVSERTEVRIGFTRDTLYVGVVCYDSDPEGIIVADSRRDSPLDNTDSFQMILDTFLDKQNGFVFGTSPSGLEYDGQVTNEGQGGGGLAGNQQSGSGSGFNLNWDGAWVVRTSTTEVGWMAEFAIPFKTLRYPAGFDQIWGANFKRNIRRKNEEAYWAPIPRQFNLYRVSIAGAIGGLQPPAFKNFKLIPYVLGEYVTSGVNPVEPDPNGNVGIDTKYNLTPSLTLDGTVNTDFAQVEVDDQQVNLDRFNLFFPEKRPFFLENAGFFSVGNPGEVDLFFSRRIGLNQNGEAIPIIGGGRVSGKIGLWNVGLLDMQTAEVDPEDLASGTVAPSNNFAVMRVSRELPNRSAVGGIFVNRAGFGQYASDSDYNRTYAADGKWGIGRNSLVSGFVAKTDTPEADGRDYSFNLRGRVLYPKWDLDAGYQEVGDAFNPEVGFLTRRGYRKPDVRVMTRFRPKDFMKLQEVRPHATYRGFWGYDGFQETGYSHLDNHWQFRNSSEVHTGMNLTREGLRVPFEIFPGIFVPPGTYDNAEAQLVFMTNQGAPVSLNLQTFMGGFFSGDRVTLNPTFRVRPSEIFQMEVAYSWNNVNLPQGDFETNLVRTRVSYSFNPRVFTQALVQYNDRADVWSMNLRFGWLQAANTGLFVVYNDSRGLYDLFPDRPERTDRSITIKFSRMFDVLR